MKQVPAKLEVGFIGLGTMGLPMACNLLRSGVPLVIWNRSTGKSEKLAEFGAVIAQSALEVFVQSAVVLLMLLDEEAVDEVLARGTPSFAERVRGRVIVNMGTFEPNYSLALETDISSAGGRFVEAPMSGSRGPAESGQLIGMTAGDPSAVKSVEHLLRPMCRETYFCGPVPAALIMKLAVNISLITAVTGLAEAFHFAKQHDLSVSTLKEILDAGPMASEVSKAKSAKLANEEFSAHAPVRNVLKNNQLITGAALLVGAHIPLTDACLRLYDRTLNLGHASEDMAAVVRAYEKPKDA